MTNILCVENFGPIDYLDFNLNKSTIFMGSNSSGKSFMALISYFALNLTKYDVKLFNPYELNNELENNLKKNNEELNDFIKSFNEYISKEPSFSSNPLSISFDVFENLLSCGIGETFRSIVENKLLNLFNVNDLDILIKNDKNYFKLKYKDLIFIKERNKPFKILNLSSFLNIESTKFNFFNIRKNDNAYDLHFNFNIFKDMEYDISNAFNIFYSFLSNIFFKKFKRTNAFYIHSTSDILIKNSNNLISNIQRKFKTNLIDLEDNPEKSDFYDLALRLEEDIIDGELIIEYNESNIEFYYLNNEDLKLPFAVVSSIIRELAPLIFYLKFILNEGDTLIIEEPEAHLHPFNQLKLMKYLTELINAGLNLIITTHSDYMLDELNNLIRLKSINKEKLNSDLENYSFSSAIDFNKLNIYNFKKIDRNTIVPELLEINKTGFYDNNFSKTSDKLYGETYDICKNIKM